MTGLLAGRFATPGSRLYDLGCSLGASTLAMRQQVQHRDCLIIGVDNSAAMLERCQTVIDTDSHDIPVQLGLRRPAGCCHRGRLGGGTQFHPAVHCPRAARCHHPAHLRRPAPRRHHGAVGEGDFRGPASGRPEYRPASRIQARQRLQRPGDRRASATPSRTYCCATPSASTNSASAAPVSAAAMSGSQCFNFASLIALK